MLIIKWIGQSSDSLQMPSHANRLSLFIKKTKISEIILINERKKVTHAINTLIWNCSIHCKSDEEVSVWNFLVHSSPFWYSATISEYHHQTHTLYFCLSYCWFDSVILNEFQKCLTGTNPLFDLKIPKLYFH